MLAAPQSNGDVVIAGDPDHPANFGRLCSKGSALAEVLSPEGRLLYPSVNAKRVSWAEAIGEAASRFRAVIEAHGPNAVAFYVSGQLLTEDYYVANKLMKGFIGSANIDTNSRLCMASSVAGHKRAFGEDIVPGTYEDLEQADFLVLTGSNLAWCHPVIHQRILAAKAARPSMQIVVIDPRETATTQQADLHLPIAPGSDVALFEGLLRWLEENGAADTAFLRRHTDGSEAALSSARAATLEAVASATQLPEDVLIRFYTLFAQTEKTVTVYSQGVNQAKNGTDRVGAIINCHLYTGRIGKPGAGPFSITGQPNAMGGREVGGLANQLACHMSLGDPKHHKIVSDFWKTDRLANSEGLKAVDLFDAIAAGTVKAVWIMATNPVDSLPNADTVKAALEACPTVIVSDVTADTDTAKVADILLPALAWGEKSGTVTNSERRISRQRPFKAAPGEARADWDILCDFARHMGWGEDFSYKNPADIFRDYAQLSAYKNDGERGFDIGGLSGLSDQAFDALAPQQWPVPSAAAAGGRFFGQGGFYTKTRRANFIVPAVQPAQHAPFNFPYVLNTGRIRDQWHSMTRTGVSARLSQHLAEPFAEIHPEDALREGIGHASLVEVASPYGRILVRALVTTRQRQGSLFVPMHWTDSFASKARVDTLVAPDVDPFSGQPASKTSHACVKPYVADWHGFMVLRDTPHSIPGAYWARAPVPGGVRIECAGTGDLGVSFDGVCKSICTDPGTSMTTFTDSRTRQRRAAIFRGDILVAALFFAPKLVEVSRQWASHLLSDETLDAASSARILAGRAGSAQVDQGALICACMNVGINQIKAAIEGGADVDGVGACTGAGTNCGSCQAEIKQLILMKKKDADHVQKAV